MLRPHKHPILQWIVCCAAILLTDQAKADLQVFEDFAEWSDATDGRFETIDFTGFDDNTNIDEQFADRGVHFLAPCMISGPDWVLYPNDGWGLQGINEFVIEFDEPIFWMAANTQGAMQFALYNEGQLIRESPLFIDAGMSFGGIISDEPFDSVVIHNPFVGYVSIDDLNFGLPVPAPPCIAVLFLAACTTHRRRNESPEHAVR